MNEKEVELYYQTVYNMVHSGYFQNYIQSIHSREGTFVFKLKNYLPPTFTRKCESIGCCSFGDRQTDRPRRWIKRQTMEMDEKTDIRSDGVLVEPASRHTEG